MPFRGQFLLGVVGCVEAKALRADNSYAQIFAFQHSVVAIAVGTVLLGTDVIFMQAGDGVSKQAVPCGVALINIVLHGTQAIVGDILQTLRQEHSQAEAGQFGEFRVTLCQDVYGDSAGDADSPIQFNAHELLDRSSSDGHIGVDTHFVFGGHKVGVVGASHHVIVVGSHPVQLQLAVIVGGCSPDVEVHASFQNFLAIEGHLCEHAGELVILVSKGFGADRDITVTFGSGDAALAYGLCFPNLQSCLISPILIQQRDFVKTKNKAFCHQFGAVFQLIDDFQIAPAFFRNLNTQRNRSIAVGGNCRKLLYSPADNDSAIAVYLVGCGNVVRQADEVHVVVDS